jgi:Protein of unknown function (DUF3396)
MPLDPVTIAQAAAEVTMQPTCVLFLRGSIGIVWDAVRPIWNELQQMLPGQRLHCRSGAGGQWHQLPEAGTNADAVFAEAGVGAGCRRFEGSLGDGADCVSLDLVELLPVLGMERASYLRLSFPEHTAPISIVRLAQSVIQHVPLHWGSAGMAFVHVSGPRHVAYRRIAALAKRYWGVQIQDMSTLQWDALRGMPGVNWLTLIGNDFASANGMSIDAIATAASGLARQGVYSRRATHGLAVAAGASASLGDVNVGDDLRSSALIAQLLRPLLLREHLPLDGPFAHREVLSAWLGRLEVPQNWLACDVNDRAN